MPIKLLSMDAIMGLKETIDSELKLISDDVIERFSVKGKRSITVKISIEPNVEVIQGSPPRNMPELDWEVSHKIPGHSGMKTRAFIEDRDGKEAVYLNTGDPNGDPNQFTIDDFIPAPAPAEDEIER